MRADDLVGPDKRPTVGMQLSGGNIKFSQELPLEANKGKPKLNLLKHGGVDKTERVVVVTITVSTNRLPRETRTDDHLVIVLLMKGNMGCLSQTENVGISVDRGCLI